MGTYAITVDDYNLKLDNLGFYIGLANWVNDTGQKYIHEELKLNAHDNPRGPSLGADIRWDEYSSSYIYYSSTGGGASFLLGLNSNNEWIETKQITPNSAFAYGYPSTWLRAKSNKIYGSGGGVGSYDEDWNPIPGRFPFGSNNLAYDSKRNYLLTSGINFDTGSTGGSYLIQLDLNADLISDPVWGNDIIPSISLNQITPLNNDYSFALQYSSYDDMYYYVFEGSIYKTNPETGANEVVLTKGAGVISLIITEGSNEGYYAYVESLVNENVVITKFNLDDTSVNYPGHYIGNVDRFHFVYVGKFVVFAAHYNNIPYAAYGGWEYITVLSSDLIYNLSYKKYMGFLDPIGGVPLTTPSLMQYANTINSSTYTKRVGYSNPPQLFKPLSGDELDIHIPVHNSSPFTSRYGATSFVLNIKPIVPYPTVTSTTELDCCLDELICDINTKLASTSCKATNRAIVGRHYGGMTNDAELLESLLWITTFDCLTCDEIEKLRCITSKI